MKIREGKEVSITRKEAERLVQRLTVVFIRKGFEVYQKHKDKVK